MQLIEFEVSDVWYEPFILWEEVPGFVSLSCQGWGLCQDHASASPTHHDVTLL